jgi:hypothetical protein
MAQHQQQWVITEFLEKVKRKQLGRQNRKCLPYTFQFLTLTVCA